MYKIAIVGASTLLGKELKEALADSSLAASNIALFDEDEGLGQLDQVGDEVDVCAGNQRGLVRARGLHFFLRHGEHDSQVLARGTASRIDSAGSFRCA